MSACCIDVRFDTASSTASTPTSQSPGAAPIGIVTLQLSVPSAFVPLANTDVEQAALVDVGEMTPTVMNAIPEPASVACTVIVTVCAPDVTSTVLGAMLSDTIAGGVGSAELLVTVILVGNPAAARSAGCIRSRFVTPSSTARYATAQSPDAAPIGIVTLQLNVPSALVPLASVDVEQETLVDAGEMKPMVMNAIPEIASVA